MGRRASVATGDRTTVTTRGRVGCLLAIAYPIVEITIGVFVAQWVGWWWLLVFVVACVVLGLGLVRYALGATGRSFGVAMSSLSATDEVGNVSIEGESPMRRVPPAQTLLIVPAGLLVAIPGLVTTLCGLVLWLPPVRRVLAARIEAAVRRRELPPGLA
jgi:UPF0716 protein FxsA